MAGLFLTQAELEALTGYKLASKQAEWLCAHGYVVELNARGIPTITYAQIEDARKVQPDQRSLFKNSAIEPDFLTLRTKLTKH